MESILMLGSIHFSIINQGNSNMIYAQEEAYDYGFFDQETPSNDPSPLDDIIQQELTDQINLILDTLTLEEAKIITLYFGLNDEMSHSEADIGEIFNTTRECIRQIREKALQKFRHPSRSNTLKIFL